LNHLLVDILQRLFLDQVFQDLDGLSYLVQENLASGQVICGNDVSWPHSLHLPELLDGVFILPFEYLQDPLIDMVGDN